MASYRAERLSFYDVMRRQRRKSYLLLLPLFLFYFLGIFLITGGFFALLSLYILQGLPALFSVRFLSINLGIALFIAILHYWDARRLGAKFIRERLGAKEPDLSDRYHRQFANLVEEMRISSGLPRVHCYILPSLAINSMAQVESDGTPSVLVSEGLLAECTRDELQSAVAHELAHILRGDAFYVTLVCSLANLFERIRQELEPPPALSRSDESGENFLGRTFLSVVATFPEVILSFLSMLLSRQREILADASAVQLCRNPLALARVIYKAHLRNSFIGDFNAAYTPLFIVAPDSEGFSSSEGLWANLLSSHPPVMKRIDLLAEMAGKCRAQVIEQVWNIQKKREASRLIQSSRLEQDRGDIQEAKYEYKEGKGEQSVSRWQIRDSQGDWQGPQGKRIKNPIVLADNHCSSLRL